ncbi:MerR family transcriptional regulator [Nocardia jinanensis]|uniref:MerR family transcriptional regulator n=1 Tax=Nocardia jinanensis TaxID=382504 RepID=A0A917RDH7_9NOCA|nr:MerR family transcriptional regulator [Nocardia jinanensis]GGL02003.1 MerR family transcriptional regulator [Nocardia jinanensis]
MVYITDLRGAVSIGEASRRTGVPVRTIRFYCDEGILVAHRSSGGHRVFTADALARLTLIRRLRTVGLGLSDIAGVLDDEGTTRDTVARERASVEAELDALAWRHAVLRALEGASDGERPDVLARLAGVAERGVARDVLVTFWRRILATMPPGLFDDFVEMDIPPVPAVPTAGHVLAVAELTALARTPEVAHEVSRRLWLSDRGSVRDERALIVELAAAYGQAGQRVFAGDDPEPGPELDLFVAAHASARGYRDSPAFRHRLAIAGVGHPAVARYWALTAEALGTRNTTGATENWLHTALTLSLEPEGS